MKYLLFLLSFLLVNCAPIGEAITPMEIDSELLPYVNQYLDYKEYYTGSRSLKRMDIQFLSIDGITVGQCSINGYGHRRIKIDPVYWFYSTNTHQKEILMVHELAHCDLGLDHRHARSILEPELIDYNHFLLHKDYYYKEIFGLTPTIFF